MKPRKISFSEIKIPELILQAKNLPQIGELNTTEDLTFLKIDDNFIHQLYPKLHQLDKRIEMPDYFAEDRVGAHISIIYPQEETYIQAEDLNSSHSFTIQKLGSAILGSKVYYVLTINSASLLNCRHKYGLPNLLWFKDFYIPLHITIGIRYLDAIHLSL